MAACASFRSEYSSWFLTGLVIFIVEL
jgi:hypothetical protein